MGEINQCLPVRAPFQVAPRAAPATQTDTQSGDSLLRRGVPGGSVGHGSGVVPAVARGHLHAGAGTDINQSIKPILKRHRKGRSKGKVGNAGSNQNARSIVRGRATVGDKGLLGHNRHPLRPVPNPRLPLAAQKDNAQVAGVGGKGGMAFTGELPGDDGLVPRGSPSVRGDQGREGCGVARAPSRMGWHQAEAGVAHLQVSGGLGSPCSCSSVLTQGVCFRQRPLDCVAASFPVFQGLEVGSRFPAQQPVLLAASPFPYHSLASRVFGGSGRLGHGSFSANDGQAADRVGEGSTPFLDATRSWGGTFWTEGLIMTLRWGPFEGLCPRSPE